MRRLNRLVGTVVVLGALGVVGGIIGKEGQPVRAEQAGGDSGSDLGKGKGFCVTFGESDNVYLMQGKEVGPHGMRPVLPEEVEKVCGEGFGE